MSDLYNVEAEQGLLGMLLNKNSVFDEISLIVKADDFSSPLHSEIFEAIKNDVEAGQGVDSVILSTRFKDNENLKELGGAQYLHNLSKEVPFINNIKDYAETIAKHAFSRKIIYMMEDMKTVLAQNPNSNFTAREMADDLENIISNVGIQSDTAINISQALDGALQWISDAAAGKDVVYKTGISALDKAISGLRPSGLYILAGRPGMGKTALAVNIAEGISRTRPVKVFSLEMPSNELSMRLLAGRTNISTEAQMNGELNESQIKQICEAKEHLAKLDLHIDDRAGVGISYIVSEARRFARKNKDCAIIIDYLGLIRSDNKLQKVHQIEEITTRLKGLAKDIKAPVMLLSQLSRSVEGREDKRPMLSDLRDSGSIEQDADVVLFAYRPEYYTSKEEPTKKPGEADQKFNDRFQEWEQKLFREQGQAQIIVGKNRQGRPQTAYMKFDGVRQRFYDEEHDGR